MTYDNGILTCRSSEQWYELERSGQKPNTVRVVPVAELLALGQCTRIRIKTVDETDFFDRKITGIFDITDVFNDSTVSVFSARAVLICWDKTKAERDALLAEHASLTDLAAFWTGDNVVEIHTEGERGSITLGPKTRERFIRARSEADRVLRGDSQ